MVSRNDNQFAVAGPGPAEKLLRALALLHAAREHFGDRLAVERDLSPDSCVVWDLAKRVDPGIRGFFVAARLRAEDEIRIAEELAARYPEIRLSGRPPARHRRVPGGTVQAVPDADPGLPHRIAEERAQALKESGVACWVSGRRAPTAWPWFSLGEFQNLDGGLSRLCPILDWSEEDALQYAMSRKIAVPVQR